MANGRKFKAVQIGGPSGGCIPAAALDTPVDYETLAQLGSIMGSGGMIVMDEDDCMVSIAKFFLEFTGQAAGLLNPVFFIAMLGDAAYLFITEAINFCFS